MITATETLQYLHTTELLDELRGCSHGLVGRAGGRLLRVDEGALGAYRHDSGPLSLADPAVCTMLTDGCEGPWTISGDGHLVIWLRGTRIEMCDLREAATVRRLPAIQPTQQVVGLSADAQAGWLAVTTMAGQRLDLPRFSIRLWDREGNTSQPLLCGPLQPIVRWSPAAHAFLILDPDANKLYAWTPGGAAESLAVHRADGNLLDVLAHADQPWVALVVEVAGENGPTLVHGTLAAGGVHWDGRTRIAGDLSGGFSWRPKLRSVGYLSVRRRTVSACVAGAYGESLDSQTLPRGWSAGQACWSADGRRLVLVCSEGLVTWHLDDQEEE